MWPCWTLAALLWAFTATPALCQSGDAEWGSGFDVSMMTTAANHTSQAAGDEPARPTNSDKPRATPMPTTTMMPSTMMPTTSLPPLTLHHETEPDECSVFFNTNPVLARRVKAQKEELAYLKAIQHGNQAVVENLEQYVGAELGEQSYEDVIQENIVGIRDEHQSSQAVVQKVVEDLEKQLEGDILEALAGMQKIREESLAFEGMLRVAADIASRLESSSQALHASFTKTL